MNTLFAEFGGVASVNVITDRQTGRSKGFAFVEMESEDAAQAAIAALNGKSVDGRQITVAEARPQAERPMGDRRGGFDRGGGRGDRGGGDRGTRQRRF